MQGTLNLKIVFVEDRNIIGTKTYISTLLPNVSLQFYMALRVTIQIEGTGSLNNFAFIKPPINDLSVNEKLVYLQTQEINNTINCQICRSYYLHHKSDYIINT